MIGLIAGRELRAHLHHPAFWLLLAAVQGILAWLLFAQLDAYQQISAQLIAANASLGVNDLVIAPTLNSLGILLLLGTPLLGMHAIAEERRNGHLLVLLSTPLAATQLLLGKWLGNAAAALLLLAAGLLIPLSLSAGMPVDLQRLGINALGLSLVVLAGSALTVMYSSFSRQQPAVFAASTGTLLLLWLLDSFLPPQATGYWFALNPHLQNIIAGTLTVADLAYFLLLIFVPLLIAGVGLAQARTARHNGPVRLPAFVALSIACLIAAGNLAERYDAPLLQARSAQVPQSLLQTLAAIEGPLVITAYAPELPLLRKRIDKLIRPLKQHHKELELRYVDPQKQPHLARAQGIEQDGELIIEGMGRRQQVRALDHNSLSRALQRLARQGSPWIVVFQGQGEARIEEQERSGLSAFAAALENQGYRVVGFNPLTSQQIPHNAALVLIAGSQQDYPANTVKLLEQYLQNGGKVLWMHEGPNALALQKVAGVQSLPGQVLDPSAERAGLPTMRQALVSDFPSRLFPQPPRQYAVLNDATALNAVDAWDEISYLPSSDEAWNETGPLDANAQRNPLYGERQGPLHLGIALQRAQARMLVIGDSDFVRNGQIGQAGNRALALGLVNWLTDNRLATAMPKDDLAIDWAEKHVALAAMLHMILLPVLYLGIGLLIRWIRARA